MDTLFAPLIHPSRMAAYQPAAFALSTAADGALEITFTPVEREDLDVYLPARSLLFFLPAGQTTAIPDGPTVTPALDALAIQILSLSEIATEARATSNPPAQFAPWWIVEGIEKGDLMRFVKDDPDEEERQATAKGFSVGDYRDAIEAGTTSFNVSYKDGSGQYLTDPLVVTTLAGRRGDPLTVRVSTWYAWELPPTQYATMPVSSSLATIGILKPPLAAHPLVVRAGSDLIAGDLGIHVAFQYWAPAEPTPPTVIKKESDKGTFQRMPAGTVVRLMKVSTANPATPPTEVAAGTLDATGKIAFTSGATGPQALVRAGLAVAAGEVLAFQVETSNTFVTQYQRDGSPRNGPAALSYGPAQTPGIWLTYGLASTTGEPGSLTGLDSHPAASLGQASAPIIYNVGIPVFLQIEYVRLLVQSGVYTTTYERAPKGVVVNVTNDAGTDVGVFRTDENGQVCGLVTAWDPAAVNLRVRVRYQIEDRPPAGSYYELGLPRIDGVVQDADPPTRPVEDHFDSSWENPLAPAAGPKTFGFSGPFSAASLGVPATATTPAGLEVVKVGAIRTVSLAVGDWSYKSDFHTTTGATIGKRLYGEHGGLLDALKTLRHAHEWWHNLTETVGSATSQPDLQKGWRELFDALHAPSPSAPGLLVRVLGEPDVTLRGGAGLVPTTTRFELNLLHPGAWSTLQPKEPTATDPLPESELALLWNRATVHHEFAHIVLIVAAELHDANASGLAAGLGVYNKAYDPRQVERETFTPLLEGVSNALTLLTQSSKETMVGAVFKMDGSGTILVFNFKGDLPADLAITTGKTKSDGNTDPRLGLFVPGALANAQWRALAGPPLRLGLIPDLATPDPKKPDLKDMLPDILVPDVRTFFQRVVWLPMRALSVPDSVSGSTRTWFDLEGSRTYPTTFAMMRHLANRPDCYPALSGTPGGQKDRVRDLFGTTTGLSWHLWNQWPP